jgi:hypothetical protein
MKIEETGLNVGASVTPDPGLAHEAEQAEEARLARRRRRVETLIYFCWGLIVIKSFGLVWLANHYDIPFNPMWVIAPTVAFALVATGAYYRFRD